jgi:hypothetical protein
MNKYVNIYIYIYIFILSNIIIIVIHILVIMFGTKKHTSYLVTDRKFAYYMEC